MLTAETITDEQIEALMETAYDEDGRLTDRTLRATCNVALIEQDAIGYRCRARCAEILNSRAAKESV